MVGSFSLSSGPGASSSSSSSSSSPKHHYHHHHYRLDLSSDDSVVSDLTTISLNVVDVSSPRRNSKQQRNSKRHRRQQKNSKQRQLLANDPTNRPLKIALLFVIVGWFGIMVYSHNQLHQLMIYRKLIQEVRGEFTTTRQLREKQMPSSTGSTPPNPTTAPLTNSQLRASTSSPHPNGGNDATSTIDCTKHRFLIFEGESLGGQGAGNLMNGLLATHLLGDEYDRIVCVTPSYVSFHAAFEYVDPEIAEICKAFFKDHPTRNDGTYAKAALVNYMRAPDECHLQKLLASEQDRIIYVQANTYPRWRTVPPRFFDRFYKPKQELLQMLPYDPEHSPSTVVHLRLQDGRTDVRKGLDDNSLHALAELLSAKDEPPYLVTNNVPYYDVFEPYGWTHPDWHKVTHSALAKQWATRQAYESEEFDRLDPEFKKVQSMQLWADWYSILRAKEVYHTHSDFSLSAIHWMGNDPDSNEGIVWSRTIQGVDLRSGELDLIEESWFREEVIPPVVDRHGDVLKNCKEPGETPKTKPPQKFPLLFDSKVQQDFMARHLAVDDEAKEQMEEWRRQMANEQRDDSAENSALTPEEIASLVSKAQKKQRET